MQVITDTYRYRDPQSGSTDSYSNMVTCPQSGSRDIRVINIRTNEEITYPCLTIHLIACHRFFEGKGTLYRLDPERACRVLELKPGENYSTEYVEAHLYSNQQKDNLSFWKNKWRNRQSEKTKL